ncbi:transcriptional regulator, GntR family [Hoeflea sp. IMCC20628]|uniref:GntR family transcriptional regulator n=1 Tax=Hoeflea sp. IMCC20628 TaxID=1620421 RepID=UPI00063ABE38|nr:GntR family transcriptional regulator [Hoeflea sp. IMCC20628]AKI00234.1 transcriptional regulator, GntR family [Hoeflea sp. IMCC20628]
MTVHERFADTVRGTASDRVFQQLRSDIVGLRLLPGTKLSEAEVAKQHSISRQPVREAFMRLGDMNLLQIVPQKATVVRKISMQDILNSRFIRTAVEVEVVRRACADASEEALTDIENNLNQQKVALADGDTDAFHDLDYEFHHLICIAAKCEPAFKTIAENKEHVDRLCSLALADGDGIAELCQDHRAIFVALSKRDEATAVKLTRMHLARLDATIDTARENHGAFFED